MANAKVELKIIDLPEVKEMLALSRDRIDLLEDLLTSARAIAERRGQDTAWERFSERLGECGIGSITAKTFRVLPGDAA